MTDEKITAIKNDKYYTDADNILKEAADQFDTVVIMGYCKDDDNALKFLASSNQNLADINYIIDRVKLMLLDSVPDLDEG